MTGSTDDLRLTVAWFNRAILEGRPAIGVQTRTTWGRVVVRISGPRRERDDKDGPCFVPGCLAPYYSGDDKHVRRQRRFVQARTLIALDIETHKTTGEVPPSPSEAAQCLQAHGLAGVVYTSHSHTRADNRYRVVMPLSAEIPFDHELPVAEIMAERLGLAGTLDTSKIFGESAFYLPSCPVGSLAQHQCIVADGDPIDADWLAATAQRLMAERQAQADRIADAAHRAAAQRLAARSAAGSNPDNSLIEKLRSRFDLADVLTSHGYAVTPGKRKLYRHPASRSGCFGASIKAFDGIERVYSHNAGDPLHAGNLPSWCTVKAIDAFDATVILDFGGDRDRAMRELAERFNLTKAAERKALAAVLFQLRERLAPKEEVKAVAFAEGARMGLTRDEIINLVSWVSEQPPSLQRRRSR